MRVLIVEDDLVDRNLLQAYLKDIAQVSMAIDGQAGLAAFKEAWHQNQPYDLIFLDILMPAMGGQECLRQIRKFEQAIEVGQIQEVAVIMITSLDDPENVLEAYHKGGATSYLVKPISQETVLKKIKSIAGSQDL